ncbi:MAG: glycosyl transferase family protein [Roseiarcus sp.]
MEDFLLFLLFCVSMFISISSLDDMFIDLIAVGLVWVAIDKKEASIEIPPTGVFIANWREEEVLDRMIEGNLARIPSNNIQFYIGVYPNDTPTLTIAKRLEERHPDRVHAVVNSIPGPTSKGQMLNEMFRTVFNGKPEQLPDVFVLHDSEDMIDPETFSVYAAYVAHGYDFVQTPVVSSKRKREDFVAAVYMDEFAERHTREMIVRNALGAILPSAGVGTCITKRLAEHFLKTRGEVLMHGTVTEDYILGVEAKRAGFKSAFAAVSTDKQQGEHVFGTREYFPKSLSASIRQKTRWVYGIDFEAMHKLGWRGDWWDVYFFMRDRKGLVTNFLPPVALLLMVALLADWIDTENMPANYKEILRYSMILNTFALVVRYVERVETGFEVYGTRDWVGVIVRWPVGIYVNFMAVLRAWRIYVGVSRFASKPIAWAKTTHEIPDDFSPIKK